MKKHGKWVTILSAALMIALMLPVLGVYAAEVATEPAVGTAVTEAAISGLPGMALGRGGRGLGNGINRANMSALTAAQQQALQDAQSTYSAAEDAVLDELVAAAALSQADVDAYRAARDASQTLCTLDQSTWTLSQIAALEQATQKQGAELTSALSALVADGTLTQAQADAIETLMNSTLSSVKGVWGAGAGMSATMRAAQAQLAPAREAYEKALTDAGIQGRGAMSGNKNNMQNDRGNGANQRGGRGK